MIADCTACGRKVWFPDESAGKREKCFYCGREMLVTKSFARTENFLGLIAYEELPRRQPIESEPEAPAEPDLPVVEAPPPPPVVLQPSHTWTRRYLWLSLALIPLVFSLLSISRDDVGLRWARTVTHLSTSDQKRLVEVAKGKLPPIDELLAVLPGHRIEGAHLSRDSWFHWVYGIGAAVVFGSLLIFVFPSPSSKPENLIKAGLYTGTIGILLLLGFQIAAEVTQGVWLKSFGVFAVFFYIVKFIGFSYASALNPASGFLLSAMGFTFGVGFCEEVCKVLPVIRRVRRWESIDWRGVYLLGLASGMGFGISEGITYASSYNGIQTSGIYAVRFISCVALHAIWSGAASIALFNRQDDLHNVGSLEYLFRLLQIVAVPMVLHGLYDTLLKKQMDGLALATAIVSLAWMAIQFELMVRKERSADVAATA